jgi:hypothetical protein
MGAMYGKTFVMVGLFTMLVAATGRAQTGVPLTGIVVDPTGGVLPSGHENVPAPVHNTFTSGSLTHQQGESNTISFRTSFQYRQIANQNLVPTSPPPSGQTPSVSGLILPEAATNNLFHAWESVYTHDTILKPTLLHELRLLYGSSSTARAARLTRPGSSSSTRSPPAARRRTTCAPSITSS